MELNLSRKKIKVNYEGQAYEVLAPSNAQAKELAGETEASLDKTIDLLDKLGLPSDISWQMDTESLTLIIEALTPQKKS